MKNIYMAVLVGLFLTGCGTNGKNVNDFKAIKVFDDSFNVALQTDEINTIEKLNDLFYDRTIENEMAPNFKYLIEITTADGSERWRYSKNGYVQKYSQEDQTIFALLKKDQFNQLAKIN